MMKSRRKFRRHLTLITSEKRKSDTHTHTHTHTHIYIYICIYKNCCKTSSFASCKVFIRRWLWVQAWFRGRSIITTNTGRPSSISQYYQTLLDGVWYVWMPYPFRCSYCLVFDLFYMFPLLCWWKSEFG